MSYRRRHCIRLVFGTDNIQQLLPFMNNLWTLADDARLWAKRSKRTSVLAEEFGRSKGGIRSRLKHLQNPNHKAYQRLFAPITTSGPNMTQSDARRLLVRMLDSIQHPDSFPPATTSNPGTYPTLFPPTRTATLPLPNYNPETYPTPFPSAATSTLPVPNPYVPADRPYTFQPQSSVSTNQNPRADGTLNPEQKRILDLVLTGRNVFLTGAAGVGKSFLLRHIVASLKSRCAMGGDSVAVTASTGIAASHISGVTLHSWAGIGIASGKDAEKLIRKVSSNQAAYHRWRTTQILIIDEVSMIDGVLFGALDTLGKTLRGHPDRPFGGIQLVLSGDFHQLPPVSLRYAGFAFSSNAWKSGNIVLAELKTIVRQEGDLKFVRALRELRKGRCSSATERLLVTCHVSKKKESNDGIVPTKLYCTNKNVDDENELKLANLPGTMHYFQSTDRFKGVYSSQIQSSLQKMMNKKVPRGMRLKRGAQVMLLKNAPEWNLVNGSRGVVVDFDTSRSNNPIVLFSNGATHTIQPFEVFQATVGGAMTRTQLPIKLAWCLTVHKSQGMTLDRLELQLDDAFDYGQAYVALSRVTSLAGLWIKGAAITQKMVKAHPDVIEFHKG